MEDGVEARDLRDARERRVGCCDARERGARVQRRERLEGADRRACAGVDARRSAEQRTAVHDAVTDRLGLAARVRERGSKRRSVTAGARVGTPALLATREERLVRRVDERVLEAARACVDDEDPHAT
jgi:hypothetical protein